MEAPKANKVHNLNLTYQDYLKNGQTIANSRIDKYVVYDKLGEGAFGAVYKGMDDQNKNLVAIKVIDLYKIDKEPNAKVKQIKKRLSQTQSQLMMICNSDNIVKCYDVYQNKYLKFIVMEFCNGGELQQEIKSKTRIPERQAILILKQIINGIAELHTHNIIHRDLKAENILSHNGVYKIADFGFSKQVENIEEIQQTTLGTITTMAPEVMRKEKYGLKADIWSVGIIFFQMVFGKEPYTSTNATLMYYEIQSKKILNTECFEFNNYKASKEVTAFLREVITIDKSKRLGWKELIKHPIFDVSSNSGHLSNQFRLNCDLKVPEIKLNQQVENNQRQADESQIPFQKIIEQKQQPKQAPHDVIRLTKVQADQKKRQISYKEDELYQWVREMHLECLKTQLIFNNIFTVIQQNKLIDLEDRACIEFIYLILTRCFNNISPINNKMQHEKNSPIVANLQASVKQLYDKVKKAWYKYGDLLFQTQNKVGSIISDRFLKIFKSKSIQVKDKFLTGNQKICYTKQQQIKFTSEQYIPCIKKQLKNEPFNLSKQISNYLNHYEEINFIKLKDMGGRLFEQYVKMILQ